MKPGPQVNITEQGQIILFIEGEKAIMIESEVNILIDKLTRAKDDAREAAIATKKLESIRKTYNGIGI